MKMQIQGPTYIALLLVAAGCRTPQIPPHTVLVDRVCTTRESREYLQAEKTSWSFEPRYQQAYLDGYAGGIEERKRIEREGLKTIVHYDLSCVEAIAAHNGLRDGSVAGLPYGHVSGVTPPENVEQRLARRPRWRGRFERRWRTLYTPAGRPVYVVWDCRRAYRRECKRGQQLAITDFLAHGGNPPLRVFHVRNVAEKAFADGYSYGLTHSVIILDEILPGR